MNTNNICFYKESQKNIAEVSSNTPLTKFSTDHSLNCPRIRNFYNKFFQLFFKKTYRIRPNYRTVRLGFSNLLGTLIRGKICTY